MHRLVLTVSIFCSLVVAGCASSSRSSGTLPAGHDAAKPGVVSFTQADFDARVADGRLQPAELEPLERHETYGSGRADNAASEPGSAATADSITLSECVPGGPGFRLWKSADGNLYVESVMNTLTMPTVDDDGGGAHHRPVATPSTHCFDVRFALPATLHNAGELRITP